MPKDSSLFFVASYVVSVLYNKPCICTGDLLPKILISSTFARLIKENWDNISCNLMQLKKNVMRLQITTFKNCNKRTLVYKDY